MASRIFSRRCRSWRLMRMESVSCCCFSVSLSGIRNPPDSSYNRKLVLTINNTACKLDAEESGKLRGSKNFLRKYEVAVELPKSQMPFVFIGKRTATKGSCAAPFQG